MLEVINERVNVITVYNQERNKTIPWRIKWKDKVYTINQVGYHHTKRVGRELHHLFSVTAGNLYLLLRLNTETLIWTLEQISDGLTI